ncbi:MAG: MOSC domain-containing protein [Deltaproteobacteria bacterium]|nr:MAG: MOSC domain-containing protein [Deltaproteobacteria bacterium]
MPGDTAPADSAPADAIVTSASRGDRARFRSRARLEELAASLPPPPRDRGTVRLLLRRLHRGVRDHPAAVCLDVSQGMPGDAWGRRLRRSLDNQLTLIRADLAEIIANGQPLGLFGDNIFVDLDLSTGNLPPGSRLRLGRAIIEVTGRPHDGCRKFRARFGADALAFVQDRRTRAENRRGIHARVVHGGVLAVGDPVAVLTRGG